jgi:hypothetical protein
MKVLIVLMLITLALFGKHFNHEHVYQAKFCKQFNGIMEVRLKDRTRVDCLGDDMACEVDFASKWAESIGQSLHYGLMTSKKPTILLIREVRKDDKYIGRVLALANIYDIRVYVIDRFFKVTKLRN